MPVLRGNLRDEDQVKITRNYTFLLSEVDGGFLADYLLREGVFTNDDKEEICCLQSRETKVQLFLGKLLCSGPSQAYDVFLKALRERYPHVAKKLGETLQGDSHAGNIKGLQELQITTNNDPKVSSTIHDEETVNKIRRVFVQHIIPMNVLHLFHSYNSNVLAHQDIEVVTSVVTNNGHSVGAAELLSRLVRYRDWFSCLLQVLCDPNVKQSHVVDKMWEALGMREDQTRNKNDPINLVKNKVLTAVTRLEHIQDVVLCSDDCINCLRFICQTFWDYVSHRQDIGDRLADHRCAETCMKILREVLTVENLQRENIWPVIDYTRLVCQNYSCESCKFSKRLAESGAAQFMTDILRQQHYIDNLHRERERQVVRACLAVLRHIAIKLGKDPFKDSNIVEVLTSLTNSNCETIRVRAMLALVVIVEEEEKEKLTVTSDIIRCLIQWIKLALENKNTRRYEGFDVVALLYCLLQLTLNDENKRKIVAEGGLEVCLDILRHTDPVPDEQYNTALCLYRLAQNKDIRKVMQDYPGLVTALEQLNNSSDERVRRWVGEALKAIQRHT